ncbi:MAG TPA: diadenylate cyclase CdaA [Bacillota bacterium]|nr:diadenylate cyclase CdaA [Bacillota bacterium]
MAFSYPFLGIISIIDIILVTIVLYKLMVLIKGTRAVQLLKGLAVLLIATTVSKWAGLYTINWMLERALTMVFVALPVVFQPELRRALERLGRGRFFTVAVHTLGEEETNRLITHIIDAVQTLARTRTGALIILERETGLSDFAETGTRLDALVSTEMLVNIFMPKTPLHDGATIIRGERVLAGGCLLPLTENHHLSRELGTRHRAGIGLSELSDALAIIVSEETGIISLAREGKLIRYMDERSLRGLLATLLKPEPSTVDTLWQRMKVRGR